MHGRRHFQVKISEDFSLSSLKDLNRLCPVQCFPMFYSDVGATVSTGAGGDWGRRGCPAAPQ